MTFRELLWHAREIRKTSTDALRACWYQAYAAGLGEVCALIDREFTRRGERIVVLNYWSL